MDNKDIFEIERYIANKIPLMYIDTHDGDGIDELIECGTIPAGFYTWGTRDVYVNKGYVYFPEYINIWLESGHIKLESILYEYKGVLKNPFILKLFKKSVYEWTSHDLAKYIMLYKDCVND